MKHTWLKSFYNAKSLNDASRFSNVFHPTTAMNAEILGDHCLKIDFTNIDTRFDDRKHQDGLKIDCAHCLYAVCDFGYLETTSDCQMCQPFIKITKDGPFKFANNKDKPD
jgi:hypothetical protein